MHDRRTWAIFLDGSQGEAGRLAVCFPGGSATDALRTIVAEALRLQAVAIVMICPSDAGDCTAGLRDMQTIEAMRATVRPLGIALHDYILWHGERCVSLRLSGRV